MNVVVRPVSGNGVLARYGSLVLLMSMPPGTEQLVPALLSAHHEVAQAGGDGMALADRLGSVLAGSEATLDLVAFGPSGPALAIVVYGHAYADVATANGEQRLALRQPRDGVRTVLPGQLMSVRAGLGDPSNAAEAQRYGSLENGVVEAGGLLLVAANGATAAAPQAAPPQPAPEMPPAPPDTAPAGDVMPPPPPPVEAAGYGAVLQTDAPAAPAPAGSPAADVLAADLATGGVAEPAVPDAAPAPGLGDPSAQAGPPPAAAGPEHDMPLILAKPDAPEQQALLQPPPPGPVQPVQDIDRSQPFESVSLLAPPSDAMPEPRAPLPIAEPLPPAAPDIAPASHAAASDSVQVLGVYCKNGHFDDPAARYCAVCGISMAQQTLIPRLGPRPPLGVLVLDDGSIFTLDKDYVIGRDPQRDPDVQNGTARPLRIDDPHGQLSRIHLRIHLEGWQVEVVDLGSANGTGVWRPGDTQWTRVPPQTRIPIRPGTQVGFGRNQMRFESHTNT